MPALIDRIEGLVFDLDGTLVHSKYDWPAIRRELGVEGSSLIDALNSLPENARRHAWKRLEEIEARASRKAAPAPGALELLDFCRRRFRCMALVTNNSRANTEYLIDRHHLGPFDLVLSRDSGFYKPSGAPLREAARRLGLSSAALMMVGDSRYDLRAAREAACGIRVLIASDTAIPLEKGELRMPDLGSLLAWLQKSVAVDR